MAAVRLSYGGHLAKMADGRIIRFGPSGQPVETLRPGDDRYGFWLGLVFVDGESMNRELLRAGQSVKPELHSE